MIHPETLYVLAKLRIAEDTRNAERARLVRSAGGPPRPATIDASRFRQRVARLFGPGWPNTRPAGA
jgi:hypothetical protein